MTSGELTRRPQWGGHDGAPAGTGQVGPGTQGEPDSCSSKQARNPDFFFFYLHDIL